MKPWLGISVGLWDDKDVKKEEDSESYPAEAALEAWKQMDANEPHDQEENAVRLAENMVRAAFRRLREKQQ